MENGSITKLDNSKARCVCFFGQANKNIPIENLRRTLQANRKRLFWPILVYHHLCMFIINGCRTRRERRRKTRETQK